MLIEAAQKMVNRVWSLGRKTTPPRYPSERNIPYTGRTQAGVYVSPDRALMNDTVWACHKYVTESCAQLPARIIKKLSNGTSEILNSHPVNYLLNTRVNPNMSPFQFRETMVGWAIIHGNAVAEIERNGFGSVVNLWPLDPHRVNFLRAVEYMEDANKTPIEPGELVYEINEGVDGKTILASKNVFHLRAFGNGDVGLSVIEYATQTIGWAQATALFGASFFGEGLHFGGTIAYKQILDEDSKEAIREELNQVHRGPARNGKWFITDGDATVSKMTSTPDESQFIETLQMQVEMICRFFSVPVHKVGHLVRMTFNNVEQLSIDAVGQCIVPWAMRLEQEATYKLFGFNRLDLQVVFEVKGLLRGDFKSRQEGLAIQRRNGVINGNFWADIEDMPRPLEGGETYIVEKNMVTMEQLKNPPLPVSPATNNTMSEPDTSNDNMAALIAAALIEAETHLAVVD